MDGLLERAFHRIFNNGDGPEHKGPRIALLPGVVVASCGWPRNLETITKLASQYRVSVLFEAGPLHEQAYRACTSTGELLNVAIHQRFSSSAQADKTAALVDNLLADCRLGGQRVINLEGVPIGLLVCGENNLLTNEQGRGNRAYVRHKSPNANVPVFEGVPIVFNGVYGLVSVPQMEVCNNLLPRDPGVYE